MRPWRPLVACFALALGSPVARASDSVLFEPPMLDLEDEKLVRLVGEIIDRTRTTLEAVSGAQLAPAGGPNAAYALRTIASRAEQALVITATLRRVSDGKEVPPLLWTTEPSDDLPLYLARGIVARWGALRGAAEPMRAPPAFVDEVPVGSLKAGAYLFPYGLAVRSDGTLVLAAGTACLELGRGLKTVGELAGALGERGLGAYAGGVALTPSGTAVLRPWQGRDVYLVAPGSADARRVPTGIELSIAGVAAMRDGSVLVVDRQNRKAIAVLGNSVRELPLSRTPYDYLQVFSVAPDGTIWVWDQLLGGIRIHAADGKVVDYVLPIVDPPGSLVPTALEVGPEGQFVLFANRQILLFGRDGRPVWRLARAAGAEAEDLPRTVVPAVDWRRGLLYIADWERRSVWTFLDRGMAPSEANDLEAKLAALWAGGRPQDAKLLTERARLYEEAGSAAVAKAAWRRALDADPGNVEAARRFDVLELAELRQAGDEFATKAIATLRSIGIENARPIYQQAIAKYELVLARAPGDKAASAAVAELQRLFSDPRSLKPSIQILEARLDDLFPYLQQRYRSEPVGSVKVKNIGDAALEGIVASVALPQFAEVPVDSKAVASLAPGATATIELRIALGQRVLENDEDLPLQARVDVTATAGGASQSATKGVSTVLHRRTALTWDQTARIAAFITPNEDVASSIAGRLSDVTAAAKRWNLSPRFVRAIRISEGLGAYGIAYVEDPDAPISRALGKATVIDTVRFARDTLIRKAGDCDDTTVLLASLLEAAGIRTAILTTPGHILLAFDSGEPADSGALLAPAGLELIASGGEAWVPVETTVLKDGFVAAWTAASALVRKNRATGTLEFLPLRDLRGDWPPLALPKSTIAVALPAERDVAARFEAALARLEQAVYVARLAELDKQAAGLTGRQTLKVRLQQGILHALFGRLKEADAVFTAAIKEDPTLAPAYVNLANVRILAGDSDGAVAVLKQGLAKTPASPSLNLAMARHFSEKGDRSQAAAYLAKVKAAAPELASRYASLAGEPAPEERASGPGELPALSWSTGE